MISTEETRALATKIWDQIAEHPETHDQSSWEDECGTTKCIAGWAAHFSPNSNHLNIGYFAHGQEVLGLGHLEASSLFYHADDERAVQLLKHIVVGESWLDND